MSSDMLYMVSLVIGLASRDAVTDQDIDNRYKIQSTPVYCI